MRGPEHDARLEKVWTLLQDGLWHRSAEIASVTVGGLRGVGRVWEIRKSCEAGLRPGSIEKRKALEGTQYEYRWVPGPLAARPVRTPVP